VALRLCGSAGELAVAAPDSQTLHGAIEILRTSLAGRDLAEGWLVAVGQCAAQYPEAIQTAEGQAERDAETMKMLRAALQQSPNPRRLPARCLGCPATNGICTPLFLSPTS